MIIEFRPYEDGDLAAFHARLEQEVDQRVLLSAEMQRVARLGYLSWSGFIDGEIVGCAGVHTRWQGCGIAWALLSERIKDANTRRLVRFIRWVLDEAPYRRVEATVITDGFEAGHRFALACGFKVDAPRMRAYDPEGRDTTLYARVRG